MTTIIASDQQQKAFNLKEELIKSKKESVKTFLRIGFLLHTIEEEKLYRQLGHETFKSFISDPDIGYGESTCNAYKNVYRYYVLHLKVTEDEIANIPVVMLNSSMGALKKKDEKEVKEEWIPKMQNLSTGDFMQELKENHMIESKPYIKKHKNKDFAKWELSWDEGSDEDLATICIWSKKKNKFVLLAIAQEE